MVEAASTAAAMAEVSTAVGEEGFTAVAAGSTEEVVVAGPTEEAVVAGPTEEATGNRY
jgi:hypothetical protein